MTTPIIDMLNHQISDNYNITGKAPTHVILNHNYLIALFKEIESVQVQSASKNVFYDLAMRGEKACLDYINQHRLTINGIRIKVVEAVH